MRKLTTNEMTISVIIFVIIAGVVITLVLLFGKPTSSSSTTRLRTEDGTSIGYSTSSGGGRSLVVDY
jgi:hypothetical protein